jgi:Ca2+-binding EF-hand superfamily protein
MNKTNFPLMAIAMTAAVVLSSPVLAQDTQKGMAHNMPVFADFDLNGDGSIAETEFLSARSERIAKRAQEGRQMKNLANAPSFQDIDTDDDGAVSQEEFAAHQAEHKAKMQQR